MNYNNDINTLSDLYNRLTPALRSKKKELHALKYFYITEKDIWNFIKDTKWNNENNLTLYDMVSDILNVPNDELTSYVVRMVTDNR